MTEAAGGDPRFGPSDYLAAERTFLAWIRTGIALMGFGFVVARFGLFLQALQTNVKESHPVSSGVSLGFGTALIFAGVAVNIISTWQHVRLVRGLGSRHDYDHPSSTAIGLALVLALIGLALAIYLILYQGRQSLSAGTLEGAMNATPMKASAGSGIVSKPSNYSVDETVAKLKSILESKGVKLFALVDHSGEAEKAGMKMPPTKLLIFGNPKGGTPLMLASPSVAIDLPLKILVAEDAAGKVWLSYNSPEYLKERHNLPAELLQNIAVVDVLATKAGE